ncbi:MAG: LLM class flavin-dependent oxidoreductase [Xanthobacteraceae bacterium]|nr:LLM class flavin-dependent oxidoreductase [Xanthobacteraceae bacterium]
MQLGFFTMPIHPLDKDWRKSLREDREAFVLADELGFVEGYCGEHVTDKAENITSCAIFLATLVEATKRIKLGTGTVNIPNSHPVAIASQLAMLDHLLDGRFIFGISPGGLLSDAEVFGNIDADRNKMFLEGIDHILKIWSLEAPYDICGKYWNVSTARTLFAGIGQGILPKPLQYPHPPIVVAAVAPFSKGVTEAAARGWDPISANFLMPAWVKSHWPKYIEGCDRVGRPADPANWRVAKSVFVATDRNVAREYATSNNSPYRFYYSQMFEKLKKNGRIELFKSRSDMSDDEVSLDAIIENLVIYGTPDEVADKIDAFREEVGVFGTMLYAGHDWLDPELARRSMILMAEKVQPKIELSKQKSLPQQGHRASALMFDSDRMIAPLNK